MCIYASETPFIDKVILCFYVLKNKIRFHLRLRDSESVLSDYHKNSNIIFFNTKKVISRNFSLKKLSKSTVFYEITG